MSSGQPPAKKPAASNLDATIVGATPSLEETNIPKAAGNDLEATAVPGKSGAANVSAAGRTSGGVPLSSKTPQGEAIGPQGRSQLGDFVLTKKLGQGGMGEVFLAHQTTLDRTAALKVLAKHLADNEDFVKRFYREARAMAKVDHPQTVRVYAVAEDQGIHYVAMEFVDGKSLQFWLDKLGKFSVGDAVHVILRCAEALQVAHGMNMVHRDIKPDNIMLTRRGQVKVADFGLAKALDDEEMSMTQSGTGLGTPYYMAPEQARNAKYVDGRSDIYALGVTLYHFLTGKLPFTGNSAMEVVLAKEKGQFKSARSLNPEVPEKLDLVIDKLIAKDPAQRFQDCGEVIKYLGGLGLDAPSLSFIDAPDKIVVTTQTSAAKSTASLQKPGAATATNKAAASAAARSGADAPADAAWVVEFVRPDGKKQVVKWTAGQILGALRAGTIDNKAKVKKPGSATAAPIAQFPEFAQAVQAVIVKQQADKKGAATKQLLKDYKKQEFMYKVKKWFGGLFSSVLGLVQFVLYLGVIAGVCYGAYWGWMTYGRAELQKAINAPAANSTPPAQPNPPAGQ